MDFESLSLLQLSLPLLLVFGAIHFGICFVQRDALRKALRAVALLPIAAAAVLVSWTLIASHGDTFVDVFAAALVGIPALCALGGSLLGWLLGNTVKKRKAAAGREAGPF